MAGDIEQLLREAAEEPTRPIDAARLVRRARREVLLARAGTAVGSLVAIVATVVLLAPSAGDSEGRPTVADRPDGATVGPEAGRSVDQLWDRTYGSVEVRSEGGDRRLVDGTRIALELTEGSPIEVIEGPLELDEDADGFARWRAGCNRRDQQVRVAGGTFEFVGWSTITAMGCPPDLAEQDRWIEEFFAASPSWRLDGDVLELSTSDLVIVFEVVDPHGDPRA